MAVGPLLHVIAEPPVDPSTDEARRWLERELANGTYARPSVWDRFKEWLLELLSGLGGGAGAPAWLVPLVVLVVVAVIALVLAVLLRRDRAPVRDTTPGAVLDGITATAAELRRSARQALVRGDVDQAVLDGYRALVAASIERTLLDDRPGRTAHEAAVNLGPVFPADQAALVEAADAFDAVRYGGIASTIDRARSIIELDDRMASARPVLPDLAGAPW